MGDDTTLGVDDIGNAVIADLRLLHNVPHRLEIELGEAHAGVVPPPCHSQRHVGLGVAADVDWPVPDLLCHRLCEFRVPGVVGAAANHVHREARYLDEL